VTPPASTAAAVASALETWCSPCTCRRTVRAALRGLEPERRPAGVVELDVGGAHVGVRAGAERRDGRSVRSRMPSTSWSSALSTTAVRAASTSSPLARAICGRPPNSPRWAEPTLRTTATCGATMPHRKAM
jgi:hypothetical protein